MALQLPLPALINHNTPPHYHIVSSIIPHHGHELIQVPSFQDRLAIGVVDISRVTEHGAGVDGTTLEDKS